MNVENRSIESEMPSGNFVRTLRSEFEQIIAGRVVRSDTTTSETKDGSIDIVIITIDGKKFNGSFVQAIQTARLLPPDWNGVFE